MQTMLGRYPNLLGMASGTLAVVIWGAYLAVARLGVTSSSLQALDITFIRGTVAGLIMILWLGLSKKYSYRILWGLGLSKTLTITALVGFPFVYISVSGYSFAPLVHGGVLLPASLVLIGLLLSAIVLGQKIMANQLVGAAIIVLGLVTIAGVEAFNSQLNVLIGDALFIIAGALWATFAVLQKRWQINPVIATACVSFWSLMVYSSVYLLLFGTSRLVDVSTEQLILQAIVQGVLAGVVAMICFGVAVQKLGAAKAALFPALVPVSTMVIGIPLTGELLTPEQTIGASAVLCGLLCGLVKGEWFAHGASVLKEKIVNR